MFQISYPNHYKNFDHELREMAVKTWHFALKDYDFQTILVASEMFIIKSKFPPTIAELREEATKLLHPVEDNAEEKWLDVITAVKKYGSYNEPEALRSLDATTRKAVETIGYRNICASENIGVERAHFYKTYKALASRTFEEKLIPESIVKQVLHLQSANNKAQELIEEE